MYHSRELLSCFLSPPPPPPHTHTVINCMQKNKTLHKSQLLFKDSESLVFLVWVDSNRMLEQVDHFLNPNGSHCYFERADICWRVERGSFQRNVESPVLDCSERGPHERMRTWQEGWKGERKCFQTNNSLFFSISCSPSHALYISAVCSLYSCFSLLLSFEQCHV